MTITLDEETHVYRVDGREVRSWSQIMTDAGLAQDLSMVPAHHLANARAKGSQVHDACALIMEGKYTPEHEAVVPEEAKPCVRAFEHYWQGHREWMGTPQVETPLYCASLDFCCTPDYWTHIGVYDLKTTSKVSRTWGLQTAAQWLAHGGNDEHRAIIWLTGKPKARAPFGYEVFFSTDNPNRRIFSALDFDVVKAAAQGDYDADCIRRWREGE